jgi:hypothetical protein
MLSLLVSILILLVIFAIVWWIASMIPIPPQFRWVVNVLLGLIFLIMIISLLMGGLSFPWMGHSSVLR